MTIADFFCGAGGSTCGAEAVGMTSVAAVNHWHVAADTYQANHGVRPHLSGMADVDPHSLPKADVLLFSPECTNHTRARGRRPVNEQSRNTMHQVVRFVEALRPALFVVENVKEVRQWGPKGKPGTYFWPWIESLEALGYRLNYDNFAKPGQIMDSADFGVPQSRPRFFLVGRLDRQAFVRSPQRRHVPVSECIDWSLPMRPIGPRLCESTQARIADGRARFGSKPFLTVYYKSGPQSRSIDRPCGTVPTRDRFGLVRGNEYRMLQSSELQKIMGFPDSYRIHGVKKERLIQLGNAVCPPVMAEILRQVA